MKTRDDGLILEKPRIYLAKWPREGVSDLLSHQILNQRSRLDPSASARGCAAGADRWARGVETLTRGAHGSTECRGCGARWPLDRRSTAVVPRTVIRKSGPSDQNWTVRMGARGFAFSGQPRAARSVDTAAPSPEVRQTEAPSALGVGLGS